MFIVLNDYNKYELVNVNLNLFVFVLIRIGNYLIVVYCLFIG